MSYKQRNKINDNFNTLRSKDGAVVRALASHQCGPRLNPGVGWVCFWFSRLLREVFLRVLRFSPLFKNQHFQIPIRPGIR